MNKRAKAVIVTVVGVLAIGAAAAYAGPVVYRDFFAAPAAQEPTLLRADDSELEAGESGEAASDSPEALDPATFSGRWVIGEGSVAGYRVDEVLNGTHVTVTGRTSEVTGELTIDSLTLQSAEFAVDVASITTDEGARDRHFRTQALRTDAHPTASFVLTGPVTAEQVPSLGEVVEQSVTGDLTIAGVTQSVTFTVQLRVGEDLAEIAGQIPITFADFGVTAPNLGFVSVEPTGFVEFELRAAPSAG